MTQDALETLAVIGSAAAGGVVAGTEPDARAETALGAGVLATVGAVLARGQDGGTAPVSLVAQGTETIGSGDTARIADVVPDDGGRYAATVFPAAGGTGQITWPLPVFQNTLDQGTGTIAQSEFVSAAIVWDGGAWHLDIENEAGVELPINWAVLKYG